MMKNDEIPQSQIGFELEQEDQARYEAREAARVAKVHSGPVPNAMTQDELAVIAMIFQGGQKYAPTWAD